MSLPSGRFAAELFNLAEKGPMGFADSQLRASWPCNDTAVIEIDPHKVPAAGMMCLRMRRSTSHPG